MPGRRVSIRSSDPDGSACSLSSRGAAARRPLAFFGGSRVRTHNHQMTAAARTTAPKKFLTLRSKRVAIRRQSFRRQNILDDVTLLVDGLIIFVLDCAVLARWDEGLGAAFFEPFAQSLAIVAFVGDELGRCEHGFDTALGNLAIVDVPGVRSRTTGRPFASQTAWILVLRPPFVWPIL